MKNAINNQVGMLGNMFLWLVANLKQGVIYFIKQACGNEIMPSVYIPTKNIPTNWDLLKSECLNILISIMTIWRCCKID